MTELRLKLHQPEARGFLEFGGVASVRLIAQVDGRPVKEWWETEKPVMIAGEDGQPGSHTSFDLPQGGVYALEVTLPRGEGVTQQLLIAEGETKTETVKLDASPHEYLGWQQMAGIVAKHPYSREQEKSGLPTRTGEAHRDVLLAKGQQRLESLYSRAADVPRVFAAHLPSGAEGWIRIERGSVPHGRSWARYHFLEDWAPIWDDEYVTWFREMPGPKEGTALIGDLKGDRSSDQILTQFPRWLSFVANGQIDLASVPWAWWGARREVEEEIRFVYDRIRPRSSGGGDPGHLTVSVQDRRWFALLEFLASGRLSRAGEAFEGILEDEDPMALYEIPMAALDGKVKGPLVAVAGAIVLVGTADTAELQRWDPWLENLYNWFPGIPDGAVLLGSRYLAQARDTGGLTAAFDLLREGVRRGIPFFSATIQILSLALAQLGGDIEEADGLRRRISAVATRVDPDQPFTVLRLNEVDEG